MGNCLTLPNHEPHHTRVRGDAGDNISIDYDDYEDEYHVGSMKTKMIVKKKNNNNNNIINNHQNSKKQSNMNGSVVKTDNNVAAAAPGAGAGGAGAGAGVSSTTYSSSSSTYCVSVSKNNKEVKEKRSSRRSRSRFLGVCNGGPAPPVVEETESSTEAELRQTSSSSPVSLNTMPLSPDSTATTISTTIPSSASSQLPPNVIPVSSTSTITSPPPPPTFDSFTSTSITSKLVVEVQQSPTVGHDLMQSSETYTTGNTTSSIYATAATEEIDENVLIGLVDVDSTIDNKNKLESNSETILSAHEGPAATTTTTTTAAAAYQDEDDKNVSSTITSPIADNSTTFTVASSTTNTSQAKRRRKSPRHHLRHSHHHPAGRALQSRLQRARSMQNVLSMSLNNNNNNKSNASSSHATTEDEESASQASSSYYSSNCGSASIASSSYNSFHHPFQSTMINRYNSILSDVSSDGTYATNSNSKTHGDHHDAVNNDHSVPDDEFPARTMSRSAAAASAAVWKEIDAMDPVLCTCFSRTTQKTTNPFSKSTITRVPLHLAIGTSSGTVHIHEFLLSSSSTNNNDNDDDLEVVVVGKKCHVFHVNGKVRSVDFSPDGMYLAVGGDSGICTVFQMQYITSTINSNNNNNSHNCMYNAAHDNINDKNVRNNADGQAYYHLLQIVPIMEIQRIDRVYAVQFSPDGLYLAVGGFDGIVAIFETKNFTPISDSMSVIVADTTAVEPIAEIARDGLVLTLDWSPDGRYLAIGGSDKCCAIVNTTTSSWKVFREIRRMTSIQSVKWYPGGGSTGGRFLAIASSDVAIVVGRDPFPTITEIDLSSSSSSSPADSNLLTNQDSRNDKKANKNSTDKGMHSHSQHQQHRSVYRINAICWSPNGTYFVVCGSDKKCTVLETKSFAIVHEMVRPDNLTCVVWGEQQRQQKNEYPYRYLAIGGEDSKVVILQAGIDSNNNHRRHFRGCSSSISMSSDNTDSHSLYSTATGTSSSYFSQQHQHPSQQPFQSKRVIGADHRDDWVLHEDAFHDMEDIMEVLDSNNTTAITSPTGMHTLTHNINIEDSIGEQQQKVHGIDSLDGRQKNATSMAAIANEFDEKETERGVAPATGNSCNVVAVAFSKGSKTKPSLYIAYTSMDGLVTVRHGHTPEWKLIAELKCPEVIQTLSFSNGQNNQYLALGGIDSNVYIADTTMNYTIVARIVLTAPVTSVTFSKNNERLGAGSLDGTFALLDPMNNFEFSGEIDVPDIRNDNSSADITIATSAAVTAVDWCSKNMAIGRIDGTVVVYDAKQVIEDVYTPVATIIRKAAVHCIAFGVSSRFLAVGGADMCVGIYSSKGSWVLCHQVNMTSQQQQPKPSLPRNIRGSDITANTNFIASVQWSPVGRYLAYGCSDGTLKVIDTLFWADVDEAAEAVASATANGTITVNNTNNHILEQSLKCLTFSQDGKFLAVAQSDHGMTVLNSIANWTVDFRVENKIAEDSNKAISTTNSLEEFDGADSSSLSSHGPEERNNDHVNSRKLPSPDSINPFLANTSCRNTEKNYAESLTVKQNSFQHNFPEVSFSDDDYYYSQSPTNHVLPSLLYTGSEEPDYHDDPNNIGCEV